ncbi:MAG: Sua5/YciO/YrdC/YwlC family protein [Muribaculaceae bacterium]|nr:Sua5/YciO/YrdC/YwlC family protein [Muribaculaceae bacterium]
MKQAILTPEEAADVRAAVDTLRKGGIILYPTDTIWGIGCDARNSDAVRRVFEIKRRSDAKALITLVDSVAVLERTVSEIPEVGYQLLEATEETPTTIIYDSPAPGALAPELQAEDGSVGVRVSHEAISSAICRGFRGPVVSTSANISGKPAAACFADIDPEIIAAADYVCTSRRNEPKGAGRPSGILKLGKGGTIKIIR